MTINMFSYAGSFGENKDKARDVRIEKIMPVLAQGKEVVLDFEGVSGVTQSFIHALISEPIRQYGDDVYDYLKFANCTDVVREVINIVADYMQESEQ